MPYIGKSPVGGGFHKLDNLTASATATYALTLNGAAYYPETANQLLCSLNGVIQAPQDSFTVSGSNLIFDTALTASDSIDFVVALGDVLGVGSVTDGAVTTNKIANGAVTAAKLAAGVQGVAGISSSSTSGTALSIDANNIVTMPARPAFRVHGTTSAWTNLVSNTKLSLLTSVDYNIGNYYNTTDHEFVAPINGLYHFFGRIYVNNTTSTSDFFISIDDGSLDNSLYWHASESSALDQSSTFSEAIQLTANQTVSIKGNSGAYFPTYSGFGGYLIG